MTEGQKVLMAEARARVWSVPMVRLYRQDPGLALSLFCRLMRVRLSLSLKDFAAVQSEIEARSGQPDTARVPEREELERAARAGRIANSLGRRLPFGLSCLVRSYAVWWWARDRGLPAEMRIGVAKEGDFSAHAWVELYGHPLTDSEDGVAIFQTFDRTVL